MSSGNVEPVQGIWALSEWSLSRQLQLSRQDKNDLEVGISMDNND